MDSRVISEAMVTAEVADLRATVRALEVSYLFVAAALLVCLVILLR